jgi:5-formyltetrahydrofolate cyclo-ligase
VSVHRRGTDPGPPQPHSHALAPEEVIRFKVKAELRKRLRGVRKTAPLEACAERSARIVATLEAHEVVRRSKAAALFWPIVERHEVDLRPLDAAFRARGVRVAYPSIDPDTGDMVFRFVDDPSRLEDAGYGFAEPPGGAPVAAKGDLDLVVVPAIAVDPVGHRIGYGAGYYDRTLPAYAPPAVSIAVAYDYQLVAEVPATEGDVPVAWVVTDQRTIEAADAG